MLYVQQQHMNFTYEEIINKTILVSEQVKPCGTPTWHKHIQWLNFNKSIFTILDFNHSSALWLMVLLNLSYLLSFSIFQATGCRIPTDPVSSIKCLLITVIWQQLDGYVQQFAVSSGCPFSLYVAGDRRAQTNWRNGCTSGSEELQTGRLEEIARLFV